jgi:hypothetical protein
MSKARVKVRELKKEINQVFSTCILQLQAYAQAGSGSIKVI